MRLGGDKLIPVDVRIICASNRNLRGLVDAGEFRSDLYLRIAILSLHVPPLCEHREDIELLSNRFLAELAERYGKGQLMLSDAALKYLHRYDFKGNVRELRGMIERAVVVCESDSIGIDDLIGEPCTTASTGKEISMLDCAESMTLREMETAHIQRVLRKNGGSIKASSKILGIGRTTLWRKIREQRIRLDQDAL